LSYVTATTVKGRESSPRAPGLLTEHDFMVRTVREHAFAGDVEFQRFCHGESELIESRTLDYLFATASDPHKPAQVFDRMRWGGQFVFATRQARQAESLAKAFAQTGFVIERGPERINRRFLGIPLVGLAPRIYFFVARKVLLVRPGDYTNRFTYDVRLEKHDGQYVVCKQVPDVEDVARRLSERHPTHSFDHLASSAEQLVKHVFPVFLTREAGFLQILQRDLPEGDRRRVPTATEVIKDDRGFVHQLKLNWLRKTDKTMSQIDFALQAADLLHKVHHNARIVHLDLRLDNFVITEDGVGFVDFGSAARAGENIAASSVLRKLFSQLMHASQIQRVLEHMTQQGQVTARFITAALHKPDRAIDLFYLVLQLDRPEVNPYIHELVCCHRGSHESRLISQLTRQVLRPTDPMLPTFCSTRDLLHGLAEIKQQVA
jgi:hypothetical protein